MTPPQPPQGPRVPTAAELLLIAAAVVLGLLLGVGFAMATIR